jgi:ABC-2 type transport system ATP-binding protein
VGEGRTLFFSSHNLAEVERVADWVGILDRGRLLLETPLEEVRQEYRLVRAAGNDLPVQRTPQIVSITPENNHAVKYILRCGAEAFTAQLRSQGAVLVDVTPLNLREVFLELVTHKEEPWSTPEPVSSSMSS